MARARNIKPGASKNEDLAECSFPARLCFLMLPTIADREGRLEDRPKRIKGELFPFDAIEMDPLLAELDGRGLIARYVVKGQPLIQILAFAKHQHPHHKEPDSTLPVCPGLELDPEGKWVKSEVSGCKPSKAQALPPCDDTKALDKSETSLGLALDKSETSTDLNTPKCDLEGGSNPADSGYLIPDSRDLIPDSGTSDPIGSGGGAPEKPPAKRPKTPAEQEKARLWAALKATLVEQETAKDVKAAGVLLGKLAAKYGQDVFGEAARATLMAERVNAHSYLCDLCERAAGKRQRLGPMSDEQRLSEAATQTAEAKRRLLARRTGGDVIDGEFTEVNGMLALTGDDE